MVIVEWISVVRYLLFDECSSTLRDIRDDGGRHVICCLLRLSCAKHHSESTQRWTVQIYLDKSACSVCRRVAKTHGGDDKRFPKEVGGALGYISETGSSFPLVRSGRLKLRVARANVVPKRWAESSAAAYPKLAQHSRP